MWHEEECVGGVCPITAADDRRVVPLFSRGAWPEKRGLVLRCVSYTGIQAEDGHVPSEKLGITPDHARGGSRAGTLLEGIIEGRLDRSQVADQSLQATYSFATCKPSETCLDPPGPLPPRPGLVRPGQAISVTSGTEAARRGEARSA
ncbi:hypothetical protein E2C01_079164 [Portunus trituberculatus]|uniref:Uncharacterized protein n=1 Tax=Portunus trituberculatus TaxID=210409 RepID=A0A5B7IS06_PORTR|nr:hypothetical protein [Portunus trituberculatus]